MTADFVLVQQRDDVAEILLSQLHELELCEQELCQRDRAVVERHSPGDRDRMAHLEAADEHVELSLVTPVEEEKATIALERVELLRRLVAKLREQLARTPARAFRHRDV